MLLLAPFLSGPQNGSTEVLAHFPEENTGYPRHMVVGWQGQTEGSTVAPSEMLRGPPSSLVPPHKVQHSLWGHITWMPVWQVWPDLAQRAHGDAVAALQVPEAPIR